MTTDEEATKAIITLDIRGLTETEATAIETLITAALNRQHHNLEAQITATICCCTDDDACLGGCTWSPTPGVCSNCEEIWNG